MLRALFACSLLLVACGSRTGLKVGAAPDAGVPEIDASIAPFPCRWGLGTPTTLGPPAPSLDAVVDETKLAFVRADFLAFATRDRDVVVGMNPGGSFVSLAPGGFLALAEDCVGTRWTANVAEGTLTTEPSIRVTGERCVTGRGERDTFPVLVSRLGRTEVQRLPRDLSTGPANLGDAPVPFDAVEAFASVDEQVYFVVEGALTWRDVVGRSRAVPLPGRVRDLAVDAFGRGVLVLLEDRAVFVTRGELGREVTLPETFPHLAVSDQEGLVVGRDGTLWTLPLPRGPARAVEGMPAPIDAHVVLAEGHAVGGIASREADGVIWRPLTCNR